MIDITGVDLQKLTQEAYRLSQPQGMGFLHFTPEPLSDEDAAALVARLGFDRGHVALSLDYVKGRACKLTVFRRGERLEIQDNWFDHTAEQLQELCRAVGVPAIKG